MTGSHLALIVTIKLVGVVYCSMSEDGVTMVGSPVLIGMNEISKDSVVNRTQDVAPNKLMNPEWDESEYQDPCEGYNSMRVHATNLDGEFVAENSGRRAKYHCPSNVDIDPKARYVVIRDLRSQLNLPVTVDRFKELVDSEALYIVEE